jgi:hypothetical protein
LNGPQQGANREADKKPTKSCNHGVFSILSNLWS